MVPLRPGLQSRAEDDQQDDDGEEEPANPDLAGYDSEVLQRRDDGTADEIDYSLEGYDIDAETDEEVAPIVAQARAVDLDLATDPEDARRKSFK